LVLKKEESIFMKKCKSLIKIGILAELALKLGENTYLRILSNKLNQDLRNKCLGE
jgi:hypothetical protein